MLASALVKWARARPRLYPLAPAQQSGTLNARFNILDDRIGH